MKRWLMTALMLFLGIIMILPFIWMISTSFKLPTEVFSYPIQWIPKTIVLDHHIKVWEQYNFIHYYFNSLKIAIADMVGATLLAALAAYGFAKMEFRGRNSLFLIYLSAMMIPPQILFVPKFIMFYKLGMLNTHWALIIPGLFTIIGVFLLRQFFMGIPTEISESAKVDGAGHFRIFLQFMLPLAKPALATIAILDFTWHWNDYENALVFLIDKNLYTVPLAMQEFIKEEHIDYNGMMAAASAGIVPMIIVFLIGQRYIIQGVSGAAIKG